MKLNTSTDPQVGYRPPGTLPPDPLGRYRGHFGARQAAHLLRRAGFGGTLSEIDRVVGAGLDAALETVLHPRDPDVALPDAPDAHDLYNIELRIRTQAAQMWWLNRMLQTRHPLTEKMALFWHGHFATGLIGNKMEPFQMMAHIKLFQAEGVGNFRTLLRAVTYDPAMLIWLDNRKNVAAHPNENYARELMELFTLGLGNFTESDVKNGARGLTGITIAPGNRVVFRPDLHDDGFKTFLGRTGRFGPDDIVDIVVQQRAHSRFLCRKLLEFFVYSDPEPALIEELARVYAVSGLDIGQTVGTILRSNVFFSPRAYRALPKSPIEFVIGLQRFMQFPQAPLETITWLTKMGQIPLKPMTVKGWDGGPTWVNTTTMLARMNYVNQVTHARIARTKPLDNGSMSAPMKAAPLASVMTGTTVKTMPQVPGNLASMVQPGDVIAAAGGFAAGRVLDAMLAGIVQHDVTSDVQSTLLGFLEGTRTDNPQPFGPETYELRTRGLLALVATLPANHLN